MIEPTLVRCSFEVSIIPRDQGSFQMFYRLFMFVIMCSVSCFANNDDSCTNLEYITDAPGRWRTNLFGKIPTDTIDVKIQKLSYAKLTQLSICSKWHKKVYRVIYKKKTFNVIHDEFVKGTPKDGSDNFGFDSQFIALFDFKKKQYFEINQRDVTFSFKTADFKEGWFEKRFQNPNYLDKEHATIFTNKELMDDADLDFMLNLGSFSFVFLNEEWVERFKRKFNTERKAREENREIGVVLDSIIKF